MTDVQWTFINNRNQNICYIYDVCDEDPIGDLNLLYILHFKYEYYNRLVSFTSVLFGGNSER